MNISFCEVKIRIAHYVDDVELWTNMGNAPTITMHLFNFSKFSHLRLQFNTTLVNWKEERN